MRSPYTRRKWFLNRKSTQLVLGWISRDSVKKLWNGVRIVHVYILHGILHPFLKFSHRAVAQLLALNRFDYSAMLLKAAVLLKV